MTMENNRKYKNSVFANFDETIFLNNMMQQITTPDMEHCILPSFFQIIFKNILATYGAQLGVKRGQK